MPHAINRQAATVDVFRKKKHPAEEPEDKVRARIVLARLESMIDRQDSVYERLERLLELPQPRKKAEG